MSLGINTHSSPQTPQSSSHFLPLTQVLKVALFPFEDAAAMAVAAASASHEPVPQPNALPNVSAVPSESTDNFNVDNRGVKSAGKSPASSNKIQKTQETTDKTISMTDLEAMDDKLGDDIIDDDEDSRDNGPNEYVPDDWLAGDDEDIDADNYPHTSSYARQPRVRLYRNEEGFIGDIDEYNAFLNN